MKKSFKILPILVLCITSLSVQAGGGGGKIPTGKDNLSPSCTICFPTTQGGGGGLIPGGKNLTGGGGGLFPGDKDLLSFSWLPSPTGSGDGKVPKGKD